MKQLTILLYSATFLLLSHTCFAQNAKTYEAYFIKNNGEILIDSSSQNSPIKVLIDVPENESGLLFSGEGKVRYIRTLIHDTCAFIIHINVIADSLYITTSTEYSHDPCRGHIDLADLIWSIFSHEIRSLYIRRNNNIILIQDKNTTIVLR